MADEWLNIKFSGAYGFDRLEKTIATLGPLLTLDEPRKIRVDLGGLVHIAPTSLALLLAAIQRVRTGGLSLPGSGLAAPRSTPVRRYLQRMNLLRELLGEESHLVKEDFKRGPAEGFRPCEHFESDADYWKVAASLTDSLAETCLVEKSAKEAIRVCLDEVCENVIHHADTTLGGFAAAQGWTKRRQFEIGIVDLGIGMRESLIKNPDYATISNDVEAIEVALKPRVSSTPERNGGIGLFVTTLLLIFNGGELVVRSGNGVVIRGSRMLAEPQDAFLPGTVVSVRAHMDRPLDLKPVYEALERVTQAQAVTQPQEEHADHPGHDHV